MRKTLTKTDYVTGANCAKNLWLKEFKKNSAEKLSASTLINIEEGYEVGKLALIHCNYSNGKMVTTLNKKLAIRETKQLLKNENLIYEAAFKCIYRKLECFVRVDILKKNDDGTYDLIEVKSASNTTKRHLHDVAFQKYVLEKNDIKVKNVYLMKPNKKYTRVNELDIESFFLVEDVTDTMVEYSQKVSRNLNKFNKLMFSKKEYRGYTGSKCTTPFTCPFYKYCNKEVNQDSIENLSRLSLKKKKSLKKLNIKYIKDIPVNFPLTDKQKIQRKVAVSGKNFIDKERIKNFINDLVYPIHHLDFETFSNSIPQYQNTRPNQMITFQASIHVEYKRKEMEHFEYLHRDNSDPREEMIKFLIKRLGTKGSITVWHKSFEVSRIKELAEDFPKYKKELLKLTDRIVDLEEIFSKVMIYMPEFLGRSSIKKILPALSDEFSYDRLEVQNGADAQATYQQMINHQLPFKKTYRALLNYCELDTLAMKVVLDKVRELVK